MIMPIIIIALSAFVGMIILQWGLDITGRGQGPTGNYAGKVNGEEISWLAFNNVYQNLYRQESNNSEIELSESKIEQLNLQAWNQLLQERLLLQEAEKFGLTVTEDEVYSYLRYSPPPYLQSIPQFQTDGNFDYQKYFSAMLDEQASPFWASVEPTIVADIKKYKVQQLIVQAAHVSEDEIRQSFIDNEERVSVSIINVAIDQYDDPPLELTDEELADHYNANLEDYAVNERATIEYVQAKKDPSNEDWERARAQIQVAYDSVQSGADFADMAILFSQDGSAVKGGDLGWFEKGRMVREFNNLAFSMKEGEVSEPFRTQFGWHIIKHFGYRTTSKVPPGKTEKEDVREAQCSHILIKTVASTQTLTNAYDKMSDFQLEATQSSFAEAAEKAGFDIVAVRAFDRNQPVQFLGRDQGLIDFAFDNEVGSITEVREGTNGYYVAQVTDRLPEGTSDFEEVKQQVVVDLRNIRYKQMCRDTAQVIYEMIQAGTNFKEAADSKGVRFFEPDPFTRTTFVRGIGRAPAAIGTAFSLTEPGQVSKPVDHRNGTVIFQLKSRTSANLSRFTEIKDSLSTQALSQKQQQLYSRWFQGLLDEAEIENNIQRL